MEMNRSSESGKQILKEIVIDVYWVQLLSRNYWNDFFSCLLAPFLEHFYFIERYSGWSTETYLDFKMSFYFNHYTAGGTVVNI